MAVPLLHLIKTVLFTLCVNRIESILRFHHNSGNVNCPLIALDTRLLLLRPVQYIQGSPTVYFYLFFIQLSHMSSQDATDHSAPLVSPSSNSIQFHPSFRPFHSVPPYLRHFPSRFSSSHSTSAPFHHHVPVHSITFQPRSFP